MPENTLKITSKTAQNGVKTRFSASPTFRTYFWTQSLEVDFFTQMAPFSTPTAEAGPGAEKRPSGGQKSAFSPPKWCFRGSEVGFSCSSTPEMGGMVTFLAFESPSTSRNIDFGPFLTFFHIFRKKVLSPSPKLKISMRGSWVEKFKTSFRSPGPIPLDRCPH